jgi:hypothetical protein
MPGSYERHLDGFGFCECGPQRSGIETMVLESKDEWGRWKTERVPACADCFGLL